MIPRLPVPAAGELKSIKNTVKNPLKTAMAMAAAQAVWGFEVKAVKPRGTRNRNERSPLRRKRVLSPRLTRKGNGRIPLKAVSMAVRLNLIGDKRQESDDPRPLYCQSQCPLMLGTGSGNAPGKDLAPFRNETTERISILVINFELLGAEFADLFFEEDLALAPAPVFPVPAVHLYIHTPVPFRPGAPFFIFFIRHINSYKKRTFRRLSLIYIEN
jgi:hypothetical protein